MQTLLSLALMVSLVPTAWAGSGMDGTGATSNASTYPLTTCAVSGTELGEGQVVVDHEGRDVRFCGEACAKAFETDTAKILAALDAALVESQSAVYPLETCVVAGKPLGENSFDLVHANRLVKLCCDGCVGGFEKDVETHLAQLDAAAIKQQMDGYLQAKCPVLGMNLDGMSRDPYEFVLAGHLVRLCCGKCASSLKGDPARYLRFVGAAAAPAEKAE